MRIKCFESKERFNWMLFEFFFIIPCILFLLVVLSIAAVFIKMYNILKIKGENYESSI